MYVIDSQELISSHLIKYTFENRHRETECYSYKVNQNLRRRNIGIFSKGINVTTLGAQKEEHHKTTEETLSDDHGPNSTTPMYEA